MSDAVGPVCGYARVDRLCAAVCLDGVALPFNDGLVVVSPDDAVLALDAAGRQLWEALRVGCTVDELIKASVEHGGLSAELARANVLKTLELWSSLGLIGAPVRRDRHPSPAPKAAIRDAAQTPVLDAVYLVGDRPVRVCCDDTVLGSIVDAACASCRVADAADLPRVDVVAQDHGLAVRAKDVTLARTGVVTQNRALARHRCLTALLEMARPSRQWLAILHASAVSLDGRCVVFPGSKGSGKSTLAAALVAAGNHLMTDDYAPLEQASWQVWPVPYAPSIKRGSWHVLKQRYPDLGSRPVHELAQMQLRYLDLDASRIAPLDRGSQVEAVIFPTYEAGTAVEHRRMTADEVFEGLCRTRSMLDRRPEVLAETLRWIECMPAYRLLYGDLDRAIERILSLVRLQ